MNILLDNWKPTIDTSQKRKAGWVKINLTPSKPTPTAGYGDRGSKQYQFTHDSLYVSIIVLSTSQKPIAMMLNADKNFLSADYSNKLVKQLN